MSSDSARNSNYATTTMSLFNATLESSKYASRRLAAERRRCENAMLHCRFDERGKWMRRLRMVKRRRTLVDAVNLLETVLQNQARRTRGSRNVPSDIDTESERDAARSVASSLAALVRSMDKDVQMDVFDARQASTTREVGAESDESDVSGDGDDANPATAPLLSFVECELVRAVWSVPSWDTLDGGVATSLSSAAAAAMRVSGAPERFVQCLLARWIDLAPLVDNEWHIERPIRWLANLVISLDRSCSDSLVCARVLESFLDDTLGNGVLCGFDFLYRERSLSVRDACTLSIGPFGALHIAVKHNKMPVADACVAACAYVRALLNDTVHVSTDALCTALKSIGVPLLPALVESDAWVTGLQSVQQQRVLESIRSRASDECDTDTVRYIDSVVHERQRPDS